MRVKKPLWLSLLVVFACAGPAGPAGWSPAAASGARGSGRATESTTSVADFEGALLARTNARRGRHGCRPLRLDVHLVQAAQQHSLRMVEQRSLSHQVAGELPLGGRAVAAGYTSWRVLAENLAWGQATPAQVFRDWVHSPSHRANLDNCRLRDVGVSVVFAGGRPWVTEDFGRHLR